jgi:membrane associated rhomboid family serine protease
MLPLSDDILSKGPPIASWTIMSLCIATYFCQLMLGDGTLQIFYQWGFIPQTLFPAEFVPPDAIVPSRLLTLITYMFMHGGLMHLLVNLLFMAIFSRSIEAAIGHPGFVILFLLCGVIAAIGQYAVTPDSPIPMVGASGAVSGILGAYLACFPRAELKVAVPIFFVLKIVSLPAWVVLAFFFGIQTLYFLYPDQDSADIAFAAHLAGFMAGIILAPVFTRIFRLN